MSTIQDTDLLLLNRGGVDFKITIEQVMSTMQDSDLLLVNRGGVDYKVTAAELKEYITAEIPMPWVGHNGGVFHVKNVTGGDIVIGSNRPYDEAPFKAWDADGTNERSISTISPGDDVVFVTSKNAGQMFKGNQNNTWDFGEYTDVSKVTGMQRMFYSCKAFNADIGDWDMSNVEDISLMFTSAFAFNQDIGNWETGSVRQMNNMFVNAKAFNADIGRWDTSNVSNMADMFASALAFNQDIGKWDTSNVTDMAGMFEEAVAFNQDISSWNTGKLYERGLNYTFLLAESFNQDLSQWCVKDIPSSPENFDLLADAWTKPRPVWGTCPRGEA